ncbi:MAG: toll/interleukin-1 receptor domain-containing protein, partial [Oligoflexia bacterium]|nr:toll/interleukin-1 receptor domain-containing protein [Oligoflexia bacterium]
PSPLAPRPSPLAPLACATFACNEGFPMSTYAYFLAHANPDMPWVRKLYQCLVSRGLTVFFDDASLDPGDEWDLAIPDALAASAATVACISPRFLPAHYFRAEIVRAVEKKRTPGSAHRLVPVFIEGFNNGGVGAPYGLEVFHGLDGKVLGVGGVCDKLVALADKHGWRTSAGAGPTPGTSATAPPIDEAALFGALCALVPGQWAVLLMDPTVAGAEPYLPGGSACAAERAAVLVGWARNQGVLPEMSALLHRLAPGRF